VYGAFNRSLGTSLHRRGFTVIDLQTLEEDKAFGNANISETVDLDALNAQLASIDFATDEEEGRTDEEVPDADFSQFDMADSIGKALALVKQVSASI
jgi:hypothetical protein